MDDRHLPEAAMTPAIHQWLRDRGCVPFTEIGLWYQPMDHVGMGICGADTIVVEAKLCLSAHVIHVARLNQLAAVSYCAVRSRPRRRGLALCAESGIGVLRVAAGRAVEIVRPGLAGRRVRFKNYVARLQWTLERCVSGGLGGVPCLRGEGPAQDCAKALAAYRAEHPGATWRELWEQVPNHYASPASMSSAQAMLRGRLAAREESDDG